MEFENTNFLDRDKNLFKDNINNILLEIIKVIEEKGYNPVNQLMGYIKTNDPIYIPRDKNSREKIRSISTDDILEYLIRYFVEDLNDR